MLESVPRELRDLKQWVCAYKGSKASMKPFERGGASVTDPNTWGDFETACAAVEQEYYDYCGFVFANNGIVGIDIDTGFQDDGLPTQEALDILSACRSYTELSRSGRGFHIFLRGALPFDGQNNGRGVEIYCNKRYFIMTGKRVLYDAIIENQEAIDIVLDRYFTGPPANAQSQAEGAAQGKAKIYIPEWRKPGPDGKIHLSPDYPAVTPGSRHICMVSLAGSLRNTGYDSQYIYQELCRVNKEACQPPLPEGELKQIVRSMNRYE